MEAEPFTPVKLICGIISSSEEIFFSTEKHLQKFYGDVDERSERFLFTATDYYENEMGAGLSRSFVSFDTLINPESLSGIKLHTNMLEKELGREFQAERRIVNIDPGYCTAAALIMATAKNFAHRVPLQGGIYAHLELLFGRREVKFLPWTYPDFFSRDYQDFFIKTRERYLSQLRGKNQSRPGS